MSVLQQAENILRDASRSRFWKGFAVTLLVLGVGFTFLYGIYRLLRAIVPGRIVNADLYFPRRRR